MRKLKQIVMAVLIGVMMVAGALAQKGSGNSNRPPKETPPVVDKGKGKPPPSNNQGNTNRPGKPE